MSVQLQYSYFPVREAELKARMEYVTLMPGEASPDRKRNRDAAICSTIR